MRVLQICLKPPLPKIDGGCKAMNNITQGLLQNGVEVKILTLSTHKHPFQKEKFSKDYISQTNIEHVFIKTEISVIAAFFNLFSSKSYNIERFYNSKFEDLIVKTLQENEYDVVLLESLYVSKYLKAIRKHSTAKVIYRAHNVESEIWYRNASQEQGLKKQYFNLLAHRLNKYEKHVINHFDGIAAITEKDKKNLEIMGCIAPIEVFPFGIDMADYKLINAPDKDTVFHIGSMDWKPNQNGIKWFLDNVWDTVVERFPTVEFNLAGKGMPEWLKNHKQKNVNIIGEVEDANDFIGKNAIMVVPLFAASGMRIKIIEGMALGKLVIATSVAAEGIVYENGKNIEIANDAKEFSNTLVNYLTDREAQKRIAINGRQLIASYYDNRLIVNNLAEFFKKIID